MNQIEELTNAFLDIIGEDTEATRKINEVLASGKFTSIEDVIRKYDSNIARDARFYYLVSVLTIIIQKQKVKQEEKAYAPIYAIIALYPIEAPGLFAKKIAKIMKGGVLSIKEKMAKKALDELYLYGKRAINLNEEIILKKRLREKSEIYKDVSSKKSPKKLIKKYNSKMRVERAMRTEAHEELEESKLNFAYANGNKFKIWKTQNDKRVRETPWHDAVAGMKVPIDGLFHAAGMEANYPGDLRLPVGERINCRCYLVYE